MAGVEIVGGEDIVLIVGLDAVDLFVVDLLVVDLGIVPMCDVIDECDDD